MSQRRSFIKKAFTCAVSAVVPAGLYSASKNTRSDQGELYGSSEPYCVKIIYNFLTEEHRQSMLAKVEKMRLIESINESYKVRGKILWFKHHRDNNIATNTYVFSSEKSYLDWEAEMVLSKVLNQQYCDAVVTARHDSLGVNETGHMINKQIVFSVKQSA